MKYMPLSRWWYLGILFLFPNASHAQNDFTNLSTQLIQQALQGQTKTTPPPPGGQTLPSVPEPSLPQIQESTSSKEDTSSKLPSRIKNLQGIQGMIISNDAQQFHGILYFPTFSLNIHQTYQGKDFLKVLPSSQIQTLSCLQWSAFPYQQEQAFEFVCTLYKIHDRENHEYMYSKIIPSISQIVFKNDEGSSLFYLYFVDYMKDNHWENLKIPFRQKSVSTPLKGVIRTLAFDQGKNTSILSPLPTSTSEPLSPLSKKEMDPKKTLSSPSSKPVHLSLTKKKPFHHKNITKYKKEIDKALSTDKGQSFVLVPATKESHIAPIKETEKVKDYEKAPIRSRR